MAEPTPQSRNAAILVATAVIGAVAAGLIIPRVITQHHVEYGDWASTSDPAGRRCVTGSVWIDDQIRTLGRLPLMAEGAAPYCTYRACFDAGQASEANLDALTPAGMDPLFAEAEDEWQAGQPPLAVWCGGNEDDEPATCACAPTSPAGGAAVCEWAQPQEDGTTTWAVAPSGFTMAIGAWRGGCVKAPCKVLAGRDWFPAACAPAPAAPGPVTP